MPKFSPDTLRYIYSALPSCFIALDEVSVKFRGSTSYVYNMKTGKVPIVIHGNGPIKVQFCLNFFFFQLL